MPSSFNCKELCKMGCHKIAANKNAGEIVLPS
jgi:hypothetical protein